MSTPNVAAIEEAYEALVNGGLDRFLDHWTDDLDHRSIEGAADDRGPIRGKDAMRAYVSGLDRHLRRVQDRAGRTDDAGRGIVVGVLRYGGRAKLSGIETDDTFGVVFTVCDRKIARGREYATRAQGLEAAGVSE